MNGEPKVVINSIPLTDSQSLALRVAVQSKLMEFENPEALGTDPHGLKMVQLYRERLTEIQDLMFQQ